MHGTGCESPTIWPLAHSVLRRLHSTIMHPQALARGFVNKGVTSADKICCYDPWAVRNDVFKSFGATPYSNNVEVAQNSEVIFIAVKPQYVGDVLEEIKPYITEKHLIVSIAAGIPLEK